MGQKNGLHTFGYNSAVSEPIWMKSGTVWAKCWRLAMTDFGRDLHSNDSLTGSWNLVFLGHANNAQFDWFPVEQILRQWTQLQSMSPCKIFEQNFQNFTIRGRSSTNKRIKNAKKFASLATSGCQNSTMITDCQKFTIHYQMVPLEDV